MHKDNGPESRSMIFGESSLPESDQIIMGKQLRSG